ncbi:MAG TPA: nitrate/sulfonate/bicarbonate ABC transporter ATP-binding protein [Stenomitos sp.]
MTLTIAPTETLIQARDVSKAFVQPDGSQIPIFNHIDLSIERGRIVALLGPSGSGKSTLLRVLTGLTPPSAGEVMYHGQPLRGINPGAAIVFQSFALFPWLTVLENVEVGLKAKGLNAVERRKRALKAIDTIGLDGFEEAYPKELSGGMRQRVGFARALVVEPELLCLDEPFSALDVLTAENLRGELISLWLNRKIPIQGILIVTHSIEEAVYLADRAIILGKDPGRIRADISITLPHERDRQDPEFQKLVDQIYTIMTQPQKDLAQLGLPHAVTAPLVVEPERAKEFQAIPHAKPGAIAGLLELLEDRGGREDLYKLGHDLHLEVDDLLPITEAAEVLGFASVREGDIMLTDEGSAFVSEGILQRKELFRSVVVERIQLIVMIDRVLKGKKNREMAEEFFMAVLNHHFSSAEAQRQLQTAIDWGRYAELFAYDERAQLLFLEDPSESAE